MPFWSHGTDEEFNIKLGKDITYSEDNKQYRIMQRIRIVNDYSYYLTACDEQNPVQKLVIYRDDESKMTVIDCPSVIEIVWPSVTYNGDHNATRAFIMENIIKRCDVKNRAVKFYVEGDVFKMDFDEHTYSVNKV